LLYGLSRLRRAIGKLRRLSSVTSHSSPTFARATRRGPKASQRTSIKRALRASIAYFELGLRNVVVNVTGLVQLHKRKRHHEADNGPLQTPDDGFKHPVIL